MSAVSDRFQRGVAHREQRLVGAASRREAMPTATLDRERQNEISYSTLNFY
jgi:hypothetical protein